jgi:hypothetical protein
MFPFNYKSITRIREGFLILPKRIDNEWHWFEYRRWMERSIIKVDHFAFFCEGWIPIKWL